MNTKASAQKTEDEAEDKAIITEKPTDISSYWGVVPKVHFKEDGTPWKWTCFTVSLVIYSDGARLSVSVFKVCRELLACGVLS